MGYRSEVAFTITVDDVGDGQQGYKKFKEMLGFFKLTEFYRLATSPNYNCTKNGELGWSIHEREIAFYVQDWKWYDGFPIVEAYNEMWTAMQSIEGVSGYFMQSGEEIGDVDEHDFGEAPNWDFAHVQKHMEVDTRTLGVTISEEESDEQVQADTHPCGQDAGEECQTPRRGQAVRVCAEV